MHFRRLRGGAAPLVLVHGFGCSLTDWNAQLAHFGSRNDTVAPDLRGHGATPGTADECSMEIYGADVAALLDQLALEHAVLVGHSMGCRVVLEAARRAPHRVAGLVLIDGSRGGTGERASAEQRTRSMLAAAGYSSFAGRFFADMFLANADPAIKARAIEQAARLPAATGAALLQRMSGWDAAEMESALDAVAGPLLVIQSTCLNADRVRTPIRPGETTPWIELVRSRVPGARVEVITGVGHFPQIEAADRVNALLEEFGARLAQNLRP